MQKVILVSHGNIGCIGRGEWVEGDNGSHCLVLRVGRLTEARPSTAVAMGSVELGTASSLLRC